MKHKYQEGYAVLRIDSFHDASTTLEERISIKEIVLDIETAKEEVDRLNKLSSNENVNYFWQYTRVYAKGYSDGHRGE